MPGCYVTRTHARGLKPANQIRPHLEIVEHPHGWAAQADHVAALQVHDADEIGDDLIVGAEVGDRTHIGHVAAETGEILAEAEQQAAGGMLVVVERVVGQSVAGERRQESPVSQLEADGQRGLAGGKAADAGAVVARPLLALRRRAAAMRVRGREGVHEIRVDVVAIVQDTKAT